MRADAARNRVRVLAAAREVFGELGPEARMEEVAHRAGVGVGTLYRHFPTKDVLLEALVSERLVELKEAAESALEEPDSWAALCEMIWRVVAVAAEDRALLGGIASPPPSLPPSVKPVEERVRIPEPQGVENLIGELLRRAQEDGEARKDVTAEDLRLMFAGVMMLSLDAPSRKEEDELWRRHVEVLLDGLRESSRGAAGR